MNVVMEDVTPLEAEGKTLPTYQELKRIILTLKQSVVSDNLLKGAALNTVQIAECLMKTITLDYKFIMQNNNPLSPHLQIYKWHISSLLSITHRVVKR